MGNNEGKKTRVRAVHICKFQLESVEESGRFSGYAAVFGEKVDTWQGVRIMEAGCFTQTLSHNNGKVPVLYLHEHWIGMGESAKQDAYGLSVVGLAEIEHSAMAREAWGLMKLAYRLGTAAGISVGFSIIQERRDKGIQYVTEAALHEWSILPPGFQASPSADVRDVASTPKRAAIIRELLVMLGVKPELLPRDVAGGDENDEAQILHSIRATLDDVVRRLD